MSRGSFAFSPTALRSLRLDEDLLERQKYAKSVLTPRVNSYLLMREARERTGPRLAPVAHAPQVCHDLVVHNALFTGDLEAIRRLFPKGSSVNLIVESRGGDLRWVSQHEDTSSEDLCSSFSNLIRNDVISTAKATGHTLQFWNALLVGDHLTLIAIMDDPEGCHIINSIYDTSNIEEWKDFRFNYRGLRLWSLTYEQELTTPVHITAGRGFAECLRHLLQRGADVELAPAGFTALHEACENAHADCVKLLLSYGANANAVSEDGVMPLHMCTSPASLECAKHLLQFGAKVNGRSLEEDDTPLHVAARHGLPGHTELYLRHGAAPDGRNEEGNTPLNAACSQPQDAPDLGRYSHVCRALLAAGADVHAGDRDNQLPLHTACRNVNADVVDLLLSHGAAVNTMCYSGDAPMHHVLKSVAYKSGHQPERVVRALLNHGSIRVWPGALPKVLKYCCTSPRTIEALLNAYDRLKITDTWVENVPPDVFQKHRDFYESLFSLAQGPRSLQHLARCKIRLVLGARVPSAVPKLGLPTFLQNYLLLEFRDYVH